MSTVEDAARCVAELNGVVSRGPRYRITQAYHMSTGAQWASHSRRLLCYGAPSSAYSR
jgi:hypothetical protein